MNPEDADGGGDITSYDGAASPPSKPKELPADLPTSLNDRRVVSEYAPVETEMYDAWQGALPLPSPPGCKRKETTPLTNHARTGQSQFLTAPILAKPLQFNNLSLSSPSFDDDPSSFHGAPHAPAPSSDGRLLEMLAAQAAHRDSGACAPDGSEDAIAADPAIPEAEKRALLQRALNMAASNGDVERVGRILKGGGREWVDLDMPDEEGTAPLIYASCFVSLRVFTPGFAWLGG